MNGWHSFLSPENNFGKLKMCLQWKFYKRADGVEQKNVFLINDEYRYAPDVDIDYNNWCCTNL